MGQGLGTGWGGLWDCPCTWATWEGWLFLVILGYFWLFLVILGYFWLFEAIFGYLWDCPCTWATTARRRAASILKRYEAGVKKMEVHYCSSKKDIFIFPLANIYKNIRSWHLEVQVSNAPEVVQIPFYLFISREISFKKRRILRSA